MSNPTVPHKISGDKFFADDCNQFQDTIVTKYDADTVPLPIATSILAGIVKIGANISVAGDGTISVSAPYTLPIATNVIVGGVKQGSNITIAGDGTISATSSPLTPATTSSLGGVIVPVGNLTVDGSGNIALASAVTATTFNKLTITQPASAATLTILNNKTFTSNNTLTLAGTDGTVMTFPSTSATIARTDASNTFTGHQTIEGVTSTGATGTGNFVFSVSPALTGNPVAPTQTPLDNSTRIATTAYADAAVAATATYFSTALLSGAGTSGSPYTLNTTTAYTWTGTGITAYSPSSTGTSTGVFLVTPTQTASGNNQTEKAVLINPTYVDGGFTGLAHVPLACAFNSTSFCISDVRGAGILTFHASISPTTTNYFINSDNVNITFNAPSSSGNMVFRMNANPAAQIFATTLNMQVTNGTPTDDTINRFQVVGNSRARAFVASPFSAVPTFGVPTTLSTANVLNGWVQHTGSGSDTFTLPTATALATALPISFVGYIDLVLDNSAASGGTLTLALGSGMTADSVVTGGTTLTMANGTKGIFRICFTSTTTALVARIG